jgi:hypothetical protein
MKKVKGITYEGITNCGKMYVTCNGKPLKKIVIRLGKCGCCARANKEAIGELLSVGLSQGIDINIMLEKLYGVQCHLGAENNCINVLAIIIKKHLGEPE